MFPMIFSGSKVLAMPKQIRIIAWRPPAMHHPHGRGKSEGRRAGWIGKGRIGNRLPGYFGVTVSFYLYPDCSAAVERKEDHSLQAAGKPFITSPQTRKITFRRKPGQGVNPPFHPFRGMTILEEEIHQALQLPHGFRFDAMLPQMKADNNGHNPALTSSNLPIAWEHFPGLNPLSRNYVQ